MWNLLFFVAVEGTAVSPVQGVHRRPLWAVMLDGKKRIKEENGHRGRTKTRQKGPGIANRTSSQLISLFYV